MHQRALDYHGKLKGLHYKPAISIKLWSSTGLHINYKNYVELPWELETCNLCSRGNYLNLTAFVSAVGTDMLEDCPLPEDNRDLGQTALLHVHVGLNFCWQHSYNNDDQDVSNLS